MIKQLSRLCSTSTNTTETPKLLPLGIVRTSVGVGSMTTVAGLATAHLVFGGVVPVGVLLTSAVPLVAGSCFMPPSNPLNRSLVVSCAGLPLGLVGGSIMSLIGWPPLAVASFVIGGGLAAGFSSFHMNSDIGVTMPTSPISRLFESIGLWNRDRKSVV